MLLSIWDTILISGWRCVGNSVYFNLIVFDVSWPFSNFIFGAVIVIYAERWFCPIGVNDVNFKIGVSLVEFSIEKGYSASVIYGDGIVDNKATIRENDAIILKLKR